MTLTYASLFSGVGGWDQGLEAAGFGSPLWMCEIGTFQRKVLAKRYPDVRVYDDITRLHADRVCMATGFGCEGRQEGPLVGGSGGGLHGVNLSDASGCCPDCITVRPDILIASPPCQDLSVAGKRAGLAGARSGLFFDFVRLARELQPAWLLMEQVPGLLSSNGGQDFLVALAALADAGYFVEWRVLDAQWFGVPQRRRRVFVVGHLGGPPARSVLFEPEGSEWDSAPSRATGEDIAGTLGGGPPGARGWRGDLDSSGAYIPEIGRALTGTMGKHHDDDTDTLVAPTLRAGKNRTGGDRPPGTDVDTAESLVVAHTLRASGFDASEDGTGRGTPLVVDKPTLLTMREGKDGGGKGPLISEDQSLTLATGNGQVLFEAPVYGISTNALRDGEAKTPSADAEGRVRLRNPAAVPMYEEKTPTLDAGGPHMVGPVASSVRRLTPTECERLMGWPDGWTCLCGCDPYSTAACTCSDGPRYAACGNGVVSSVAAWVASRLREVAIEQAA